MAEVYRDEVIKTELEQVGYSSGSSKSSKYSKDLDSISYYNTKKDGEADWCAIKDDWTVYKNTTPQTASDARSVVYEPNRDNCGAGCKQKIDYYKANGAWYPMKNPCPAEIGDEIFFWDKKYISSKNPYGVYHVGRVVDWDSKYLYTVEGNTNGRGDVSKRSYSYSDGKILGFGRPKWTANTRPQPNPEPAPEPDPDPIIQNEYTVNVGSNSWLTVRNGPSVSSKEVGRLFRGATVTIIERKDNWGRISGGSWVCTDYLK